MPEPRARVAVLPADAALVRYASSLAPLQGLLATLVGQAGLLVLLSDDRGPDRERLGHGRAMTARMLAREAGETLAGLSVPEAAASQYCMLRQVVEILNNVLAQLDRASLRRRRTSPRLAAELVRSLKNAGVMLRRAALPEAGLAVLDLEPPCCSCVRPGASRIVS